MTILGEATSGDIVETHLWMGKVFGPDNATFDLFYDWRKILPDGSHERIAMGEMRASWVKILDHGIVAPEPLPDYFNDFGDIMGKVRESGVYQPLPEPLKTLATGDDLFSSPEGPRSGHLIIEELLQPTLEDANLVGNVYFSNYSRWQGIVRDKYFYNLAPEFFRGTGTKGELITTFCEVEHLREAMPFDKIVIAMHVVNVGSSGVDLRFDYFRQDADGSRLKLAVGKQTTVWSIKDEQSVLKAAEWPEVFKNALLEKAGVMNTPLFNNQSSHEEAGFTFLN